MTLLLGATAIPLEPLRVETTSLLPLHREQIEERRRLGFGRFITSDDIAKRPGGLMVPEVLQNLPGLRISDTGHGDLVVQIRNRPTLEPRGHTDPRLDAFLKASQCPVTLYVDGMKWTRDYDFKGTPGGPELAIERNFDFMNISASEVDVIEVYSGAGSVPAIFSGSDAECGGDTVVRRSFRYQALPWSRDELRGIASVAPGSADLGDGIVLALNPGPGPVPADDVVADVMLREMRFPDYRTPITSVRANSDGSVWLRLARPTGEKEM